MILFHFLENLPWFFGAIIIVSIFVIVAAAGTWVVRKTIDTRSFRGHHDVAGFVFTNLGVLYSVLLGFTVLNVQERFDKVKQEGEFEASYISQIYRDAEAFGDKDKHAIQKAIKAYTESVVAEDWSQAPDPAGNPVTTEALANIWITYYNVKLLDKKQELWYAESINKLNSLTSARLSRQLGGGESLGSEMWSLLILGGMVIISFVWFFHVESLLSHVLMASILAATTAFLLFLIFSLDSVFSGEVKISSEAFVNVLESFKAKK